MITPLSGIVLRKTPMTDRDNINPVWKAEIRCDEGDLPAIIKKIPNEELIIECFCSLLGKEMGLPIPRPIIVMDEELGLMFGSEEMKHPDLKRAQLSDFLITVLLDNWDELPLAAAFDEWIANPDRHGGNLLADGVGGFWLIDHGLALNKEITPEDKLKNYLLNFSASLADNDIKKQSLLRKLSNVSPTPANDKPNLSQFTNDKNVIKFLEDRSQFLYTLFRKTVLNHDELPGI